MRRSLLTQAPPPLTVGNPDVFGTTAPVGVSFVADFSVPSTYAGKIKRIRLGTKNATSTLRFVTGKLSGTTFNVNDASADLTAQGDGEFTYTVDLTVAVGDYIGVCTTVGTNQTVVTLTSTRGLLRRSTAFTAPSSGGSITGIETRTDLAAGIQGFSA